MCALASTDVGWQQLNEREAVTVPLNTHGQGAAQQARGQIACLVS